MKRAAVWLLRIGNCRGFGIQSPWAYSLVCDVINEHRPYYAYPSLQRMFPRADVVKRRISKLLMRLANHIQPSAVVAVGFPEEDNKMSEAYTMAGCRRCRYIRVAEGDNAAADAVAGGQAGCRPLLLYLNGADTPSAASAVKLLPMLRNGDYMLLEGIRASGEAREAWQRIAGDAPGVQTFDLYYCGLVYADTDRYKQNYIINF